MTLTIVPADGDLLEQWRAVHNRVVAPAQFSAKDVSERAVRNTLSLGYVDGVLIGNATVRAPEDGVVTVIVPVLPDHRCQGFRNEYLELLLRETLYVMAKQIKTVVLADNANGLAFAVHHGFEETTHYEVDGVAFVELTLRDATA